MTDAAPTDTYICYLCQDTFGPANLDDATLAEMEARFGPLPEKERALICDDCWRWMEIARTILPWRGINA
jgi:hypothetical protein